MVWKLVIVYYYYRYRKFIIPIGFSTIILALIILYFYVSIRFKTYDYNILVTSDKIIDGYDLGNDYYLYYDDIKVNFHGKDIYMNMSFSICDEIDNLFEIIVPDEYSFLLNKNISFYIGDNLYTFLVVGVYDGAYNDMFIYTNALTMKEIYSKEYDFDNYIYDFVVSDYESLNSSLDILSSYDYDVSIVLSKRFVYMSNYESGLDLILIFLFFFSFIFVLFYV